MVSSFGPHPVHVPIPILVPVLRPVAEVLVMCCRDVAVVVLAVKEHT